MVETIKLSVSVPKTLFEQTEILAQHLNLSQSRLLELALETFVHNAQSQMLSDKANQTGETQPGRLVNQGDIYWVQLEDPDASEPRIPHPHVVIQDNLFNHSRVPTVVVCALTSNINRASIPGNVLLDAGEADLPRQSVVETSKISTVEKTQLGDYIGSLDERRIHQILDGMRFLQRSFFEP